MFSHQRLEGQPPLPVRDLQGEADDGDGESDLEGDEGVEEAGGDGDADADGEEPEDEK